MKTVFFDVDTQIDFLFPAGALYVPGAEDIFQHLTELTRFAAAHAIQIISTADAHEENDPEFGSWKPHCVVGTVGQLKPSATLLPQALVVPSAEASLENIQANVQIVPQIFIEKQSIECFTNPNLHPLLKVLNPQRYVVYGVVVELCVRRAVFGLLKTGARVELVTDATISLDPNQGQATLADFQAAGGFLTTVAAVTA
ncbi:MAG: cysteine hydrolase family protein [Acidobacteriaceae bacterium]|nr:cysteine hydrolase family protein [Acidobacteriaceae bacterium]MBV9036803.1 cysteine hydrolase family protein [Acidobacteriaceae bacterium]MBV9674745.1 cysteine hydrolase family protein [Acidobacteriaceae bacterium]